MVLGKISKWAVMNLLCLKLEGREDMDDILNCVYELKTEIDYGDFTRALMGADMNSYYKTQILSHVPSNGNSALYSALISVVESVDMSSYYKDESVKQIVKRFEQGGR